MDATTPKGKTKTDWGSIDTQLEYEGTRIVLPADPTQMPIQAARDTLDRIEKQENQKYDVHELVAGAPWDALVAVNRALKQIYGVVLAQSTFSPFGEIKPDLITVRTGIGAKDVLQVAMGNMMLPNVEDKIRVMMHSAGCYIIGNVKNKDKQRLVDIASLARDLLQSDSVYRGKAIHLNVDSDGNLDLNSQPTFIDLEHVRETDMIHTRETEALIRTNMFAPLKNTEACRRHRIPLKRGILLDGRYGTGKTLTARVTAKVGTDHEWTFIMLNRAQGLKAAIEFAKTYQPAIIFGEDIDRYAEDRGEESVNDLVNMMDGLITKDMEIMVVLTTNFIDKIDKALLRPGRFDAVISLQEPDAETAAKLVRAYARDLLDPGSDLMKVGVEIQGEIPATIREVVERAKLVMLTEGRERLEVDDLYISAVGMKQHMALLRPKDETSTPQSRLWDAMSELLGDKQGIEDLTEGVNNTRNYMKSTVNNISRAITGVSERVEQASLAASIAADNSQKAREQALDAAQKTTKVDQKVEKVLKAVS